MILSFLRLRILNPMGAIARCTALCVAASIIVASTDRCATPEESGAAEILAIQSMVAEVLSPTSPIASGQHHAHTVLDVQRILNGLSDSEEEGAALGGLNWWAVVPAPMRTLTEGVVPVAQPIAVPVTESNGALQQVQPFPPPPQSRVVARYRMMLTPHAPPASQPLNLV